MYLARVTGTVVATQKAEGLEALKLLLVEPVDDEGRPAGAPQVAVDAVQAGVGELVYVCTGREASMALDEPFAPVDLAIVGHVDDVDIAATPSEPAAKPVAKKPAPRRRAR
jgi:ethanolamine utilization protein EutN